MYRGALLSVLVALAVPTVGKAVVKIDGETTISEHKLFRLSVPNLSKSSQVDWDFTPDDPKNALDVLTTGDGVCVGTAPPGTYTLKVLVVDFDLRFIDRGRARITILPAGADPKNPPTNPPPVVTPPPKDALYYFVVVRSDGPASANFTKEMARPEWATLQGQGHKVKDFEWKTAVERGWLPPKGDLILPCVVTLRESADGKTSTIVRNWIPLPTSPQAILDLPKVGAP